jgi:hypothetical protein
MTRNNKVFVRLVKHDCGCWLPILKSWYPVTIDEAKMWTRVLKIGGIVGSDKRSIWHDGRTDVVDWIAGYPGNRSIINLLVKMNIALRDPHAKVKALTGAMKAMSNHENHRHTQDKSHAA